MEWFRGLPTVGKIIVMVGAILLVALVGNFIFGVA